MVSEKSKQKIIQAYIIHIIKQFVNIKNKKMGNLKLINP